MKMIDEMQKVTTPTHHLLTLPQIWLSLFTHLNDFFVVSESVRIEKRFTAEGTHQPHSQVYSSYVHIDGGMGGWWALPAASTWHL